MISYEQIITAAAILSGLGIAYTYAGYPLLLWMLARLRNREVKRAPWTGSVSVVLVARNAEGTVRRKLENLLAQKGSWNDFEVVVSSDGSTDGTADAVKEFANPAVKLLAYSEHRGKAAVLNDAVPQCSGEIIVFADIRQRFEKSTVSQLCTNFADPEVGAVSGELLFENGGPGCPHHGQSEPADAGIAGGLTAYWNIEKWIRKTESRTDSVIGCTGAVYALRKECFQPLHPDTVLDDVAIPMNVILAGKRVVFESNARAWDRPEEDSVRESTRKTRTLAGNIQLCALYPGLINPFKNRLLLRFFSHKLMRLFAPWLLILFLASTIYLSRIYLTASLLALVQLIFYSLAVSGTALYSTRLTLLKLPAAFLLLNVWAAIAPFHYWRGKLSPRWG